MTLVLTLLCRDEADILESMLRFHLERGVDLIIATDNGSVDGSLEILQRFERGGRLRLLQEPQHTHDQAVWVTRMARLAAELGASWVIHSDADEFWWPRSGDLKTTLEASPAGVEAWSVVRRNLLPPPRDTADQRPFYRRQTLLERQSLNSNGKPLPPKVCHRADPRISVSDGNHSLSRDGQRLITTPHEGLEILHVPIRSYPQLERKIRQGAEALERNRRVDAEVGNTWRRLYREQLQTGQLLQYYDSLRPSAADLRRQLNDGHLLRDQRLADALERTPRVAVITPYYRESRAVLEQCHQSVLAQTVPCLHVLVADGHPKAALNHWDAHHVRLPRSHGDIGSTPRLIGSYHAIGLGVDAVAFLDADNWYGPNHIATLLEAMDRDQAGFVSSSRTLCRLDGSVMGRCPLSDPDRFIDTNAMLFGRAAFPLLHQWVLMPEYGHLIGDRIMLDTVKRSSVRRTHVDAAEVFYRCNKAGLYRQMGEAIPKGVQARPDYEASFRQWEADGNPPLS